MKKNNLFLALIILTIVVVTLGVISTPVLAQNSLQDGIDEVGNTIATPGSGLAQDPDAASILTKAINWLLSLVALLALLALVWGGMKYILALGDEKKAADAKKVILYAITGLMITGLSFAIIKMIQTFLTT